MRSKIKMSPIVLLFNIVVFEEVIMVKCGHKAGVLIGKRSKTETV